MRLVLPIAILCAVLASPAAAQENGAVHSATPMPATDPGTWVRPEDYPAWAVAYDVEGRVGVKLDVSANGRVTSCEVTRSSGVADLDRIACEKVTERGRFVPARDEDGDPVAGTWASGVVWQVPDDDDHAAPMPGFLVVSMVVEPDGAVSDCRVERARAKRRNSRRTSAATAASSRFSMRRAIRNASAFGS